MIFDTDTNNELDDQFALAYLLFNGHIFDIEGVTVNATRSGGKIEEHYEEAKRILQLANLYQDIPLLKGANGSFEEIRGDLARSTYDGKDAVDFIIEQANADHPSKLIVLAVGKLTNVALALERDTALRSKIEVVWLGSNYPKPGEYNQDNDTVALNYVLKTAVPFEMVTVRYGASSGTDAVKATKSEIEANMPGLGPKSDQPVTGRHGGSFVHFGDYAVNLFEHIDYHGDPPSRALFDMAAVAILKNPEWAKNKEIPAPVLMDNAWQELPENPRRIILWEDFDKNAIMEDFYSTMRNPQLVKPKL
ncbi:nucleoside hydrolase [Pararhodonellum marinum]|uniref:nucleoside hydrolase n=1 Tax=Pararhodonellum marinum TaxID=2755358 RepID=UPI00293C115F|nr:nucleoside hydrolase [Pararhodonellum marinum]